ncbi:RING finger protein 148 isoform X2 [Ctenopharyngodon idella]|uniref:RING finger protein 148 isoform X2 n=1 Tax=Ctenopharyngodon idella TaxID=7959 RepID=UPI002232A1B6|nr:RING finger protein 148 isoform X2 [Ctenopharyngodon idella]
MKAMLRAMHGHGHSCIWLTVLVFQYCFQQSASLIYWTAYVDVRYFDRESNETISSVCECGAFGQNSPLEPASGLIVLPNTDPLACSRNTTFTSSHQPWIALIKNGNCTYSWKIKAAQRHGASAVVIYNIDGAGNYTSLMPYTGADDIVAITLGNILGTEITNLTKNGSDVYMAITVANKYGLWYNTTWAYALSFTFIGITAITMFYFVFLLIKRMYIKRQLRMQQREMKKVAEKAIAKLQVRTLRTGDPEVDSEDITCVVCTDSFTHNEQVTVLPCRHLYHKKCIEPWLLEHPTCPMCKFNILKFKIDEESDEQPSSSPSNNPFCLAAVMTVTSADQHNTLGSSTQTAETLGHTSDCVYCEPDIQTQYIYENQAFEEEPEIMEQQDINSQD